MQATPAGINLFHHTTHTQLDRGTVMTDDRAAADDDDDTHDSQTHQNQLLAGCRAPGACWLARALADDGDLGDKVVVVDEDTDAQGVVVWDDRRPRREHLHGHVRPVMGDRRRRQRRIHAHQLRP